MGRDDAEHLSDSCHSTEQRRPFLTSIWLIAFDTDHRHQQHLFYSLSVTWLLCISCRLFSFRTAPDSKKDSSTTVTSFQS